MAALSTNVDLIQLRTTPMIDQTMFAYLPRRPSSESAFEQAIDALLRASLADPSVTVLKREDNVIVLRRADIEIQLERAPVDTAASPAPTADDRFQPREAAKPRPGNGSDAGSQTRPRFASRKLQGVFDFENGHVVFDLGGTTSPAFKLPNPAQKAEVKHLTDRALAWGRSVGATDPGQINAIRKVLTDEGYHIVRPSQPVCLTLRGKQILFPSPSSAARWLASRYSNCRAALHRVCTFVRARHTIERTRLPGRRSAAAQDGGIEVSYV